MGGCSATSDPDSDEEVDDNKFDDGEVGDREWWSLVEEGRKEAEPEVDDEEVCDREWGSLVEEGRKEGELEADDKSAED